MLNKVMIIGRLGKEPEMKYTQSGMPIANMTVATSESFKDRNGERQERTEWHRVVVFDKAAENCGKFLAKGSLVYVEGRLTTREWQDQNGQKRYTTEIRADRVQFLDRKQDGEPERQQASRQQKQDIANEHLPQYQQQDMNDLPF